MLKFKLKIITATVEHYGFNLFKATFNNNLFLAERILTLQELKENFLPINCEALDVIDPDRVERICNLK